MHERGEVVLFTGTDQNKAITATNAPMMRVKLAVREEAPPVLSAALAGVLLVLSPEVLELTLEVPLLSSAPEVLVLAVWLLLGVGAAEVVGVVLGGGTLRMSFNKMETLSPKRNSLGCRRRAAGRGSGNSGNSGVGGSIVGCVDRRRR
jgi:hypothetical protein